MTINRHWELLPGHTGNTSPPGRGWWREEWRKIIHGIKLHLNTSRSSNGPSSIRLTLARNKPRRRKRSKRKGIHHRLRSVSSSMYIEEGEDHITLSFLPMSKTGSSFFPFFFLVKPLFDWLIIIFLILRSVIFDLPTRFK